MHKVVFDHEPQYLYELLPNTVNAHVSYNLRNKDNRREFLCRTEKFKNSFIPNTIKKWNALPNDVKEEANYVKFNAKLSPNKCCNPLYYFGKRKINVIHAQIRLRCSNLNNDLFEMHVIDSPMCPCSLNLECARHFFFHCPLYITERLQMFAKIDRITERNLEYLLYGNKRLQHEQNLEIFSAVHEFIEKSGRFL